METARENRIVYAIVAAFLVLLIVGVAFSQQPSKAQDEPNSTEGRNAPGNDARGTETSPLFIKVLPPIPNQPHAEEQHGSWHENPDWWVAIGTFFLFLATLGLFVFTAKLWGATKALVSATDITAKQELRAYVSAEIESSKVNIGPRTIHPDKIIRRSVEMIIVYRNSGQTPAYDVVNWFKVAPSEFPKPSLGNSITDDSYSAKVVIHPGGTRKRPILLQIPEADLEEMKKGDTTRLYIWGEISYRDAFKERQCTRFRLMYGGADSVRRNSVYWCDEGNEAT